MDNDSLVRKLVAQMPADYTLQDRTEGTVIACSNSDGTQMAILGNPLVCAIGLVRAIMALIETTGDPTIMMRAASMVSQYARGPMEEEVIRPGQPFKEGERPVADSQMPIPDILRNLFENPNG